MTSPPSPRAPAPAEGRVKPRYLRVILGKLTWILVGFLIGAVVNTPIQQFFTFGLWHIENTTLTASPTCADPGWYHEVKPTMAASYSQYTGDEPNRSYRAGNTVDNNPNTAWVGYFTNKPENDWIGWKLLTNTHVKLVCIRNGLTDTYGSYVNNGRIKTAQLTGCGSAIPLTFPDHVDLKKKEIDRQGADYQSIPTDCNADHLHLTVTSIYAGSAGSNLVSVADVRFYEGWHLRGDNN